MLAGSALARSRTRACSAVVQARPAAIPARYPSAADGTAMAAAWSATEGRIRPGVAPIARSSAILRIWRAIVRFMVTPTRMTDRYAATSAKPARSWTVSVIAGGCGGLAAPRMSGLTAGRQRPAFVFRSRPSRQRARATARTWCAAGRPQARYLRSRPLSLPAGEPIRTGVLCGPCLCVGFDVLHNNDDLSARAFRDRVPDGQAIRGKMETIGVWQRISVGKRVSKRGNWLSSR